MTNGKRQVKTNYLDLEEELDDDEDEEDLLEFEDERRLLKGNEHRGITP